jgi:hypothetical protein
LDACRNTQKSVICGQSWVYKGDALHHRQSNTFRNEGINQRYNGFVNGEVKKRHNFLNVNISDIRVANRKVAADIGDGSVQDTALNRDL